jgi:hypothetical protein
MKLDIGFPVVTGDQSNRTGVKIYFDGGYQF